MTPTLRTERLLLEPYVPEDEESFVALFGDPRVTRWVGEGPAPESENRALFWRVFPVYAEHRFDVWAVRRDGQYVGHAELKPTETSGGYEIIYALAQAAWGAGLGTELAAALVGYGFQELGLPEVHATVAAANGASLAVLRKLGFVPAKDLPAADGGVTRLLTRHHHATPTERTRAAAAPYRLVPRVAPDPYGLPHIMASTDRPSGHQAGGAGKPSAPAGAQPWLLDELRHAGAEHLDPEFVAGFDRKQGNPDFAPDLAVLRDHGVGPESTVVDLGAGTGRFALAAARTFRRVIAADVSPAMLTHLGGTAAAAGLTNLECVRAGFLSYEHTGAPADAVYTRHALHQLPDFWKAMALHRIARVLRPGGVLRVRDLIYDFAPAEAAEIFDGWFAAAAADPATGYTAADYAEHIRTEHSTFRWLFEPMLTAAGFEIISAEFTGRLYGAYTCVRRPGSP